MVVLATGWRVNAKNVGLRFDELCELCTLAGDKTSLAIGMMGPLRWAEKTVEWTAGDPAKGNLIVGSPLAVALALRGRRDFDDALALAESAEPMTLASVLSWRNGMGTINGVLRADDAAVEEIEKALQAIEASGDDYAVGMVKFVLGCQPGRELLAHVRDMCTREQARDGEHDGAIRLIRKSLNEMVTPRLPRPLPQQPRRDSRGTLRGPRRCPASACG